MQTVTPSFIQDYEHCPRRYYLTYIRQLTWPSVLPPSDPASLKRMQQGSDFHLLVEQYVQGIPLSFLRTQGCEEAQDWLDLFLTNDPLPKRAKLYPEIELSYAMSGLLWLGKIDLLAVSGDRIDIFDWKTSEKPGAEKTYRESPQTRLYRWLARTCGKRICGTGSELPADHIRMIYWFPNRPKQPVILPYDEAAYAADTAWMEKLARDLTAGQESAYLQVPDRSRCNYCPFLSYCNPAPLVPAADEDQPPLWDDVPLPDPEERFV